MRVDVDAAVTQKSTDYYAEAAFGSGVGMADVGETGQCYTGRISESGESGAGSNDWYAGGLETSCSDAC